LPTDSTDILEADNMFKPVSAKEERLLPVYVYGSESLEHQAQISRGKGFMLHSQISVCYSGEGVFTDHNNVSHKVQSGDIMYFTSATSNSYKPTSVPWKTDYIVMGGYALIELMMFLGYSKSGVIHLTENIKEKELDEVVDDFYFNKEVNFYKWLKNNSFEETKLINIETENKNINEITENCIEELKKYINLKEKSYV